MRQTNKGVVEAARNHVMAALGEGTVARNPPALDRLPEIVELLADNRWAVEDDRHVESPKLKDRDTEIRRRKIAGQPSPSRSPR